MKKNICNVDNVYENSYITIKLSHIFLISGVAYESGH
jgi:hypothetical protein